ncbi:MULTISPECIES: DUF3515 family protein [Micrococcus]|uniref:DUF3515 family protein n=1 Tax=Micrococcus TaxID=1269 RepID=UPI0010C81632|nr:DUF3515 family protein [Micrococcus endophyticus]MCK6090444.1 DUF3515 domain-containing protein [Micrococcus endophyticus]QCP08308.1 DUF3515 family protein [Micrococcus luteus]
MESRPLRPLRRLVPLLTAIALGATACSGRVATVEAAPDAANPECAPAMVAMPDALGDAALRPTDSQATAVWGDPAAVVLRCGAPVPGPTTDRCISVDGVDWVIRDEDENWRIVTYGRDPAVEVLFGKDKASSDTVMVGLASAVAQIDADGGCVNLQDATPVG